MSEARKGWEGEGDRCPFMNMECEDLPLSIGTLVSFTPRMRLQWCINCILGRIAREISLLRITQS